MLRPHLIPTRRQRRQGGDEIRERPAERLEIPEGVRSRQRVHSWPALVVHGDLEEDLRAVAGRLEDETPVPGGRVAGVS